jgi:acyl-homoserine lactone acylase PvdQ
MAHRRCTTLTTAVLAAALALTSAASGTAVASPTGEELDGVWSIMPPGADGSLSGPEALAARAGKLPPHFADQLAMYGDLVYDDATPGFRAEQLDDYFRRSILAVPEDQVERRYSPGGRTDVEVVRDSFGVPHIEGQTREAAMFGQGYAAAEDRLFLMDALRRAGRAELSAWLGPSAGNQALDAEVLTEAPYTEGDLTAQLESLAASGPDGAQAVSDNAAYVEGINSYVAEARVDPRKLPAEYLALQLVPEDFVPEDVVANSAFIGGIFGNGGGTEVRNLCAIRTLEDDLGPEQARAVFDDLRFADDEEAPVTTPDPFPFLTDLGPVDPAAVPDLDCDSLTPVSAPTVPSDGTTIDLPLVAAAPTQERSDGTIDLPWGEVTLRPPDAMSNALLVAGDRTDTGVPMAVMGPQTGYFAPQLFWERSVRAPGVAASGVGIAGGGSAVTIGRGLDYAWSVTSGNSDNIDHFVLELCEPDGGEASVSSMGYLRGGACVPIETHEEILVAKPSAGGLPGSPDQAKGVVIRKYFERAPDYGAVNARGTLRDGTPVAVARARTTYLNEVAGASAFVKINDPARMDSGFEAFRRAIFELGYTYNWLWADQRDIGYQLSCACPRRTPGVDPDLPVRGDGRFDWTGRLALDELPHDTNPESGYLIAWNNRQAPQWRTSDSQFGWGPVHRSQLLERRIQGELAEGPVSIGELVDITELAGTTDLRGQEVLPHVLRLMESRPASDVDERAVQLVPLLREWMASGSHRRDHDRDGAYEHATAIAAVDAWWEPLVDAVLEEGTADARNVIGITLHDNHKDGSAFQDSLYAHVQKDVRQVLGEPVRSPFSRTYCGGGDAAACAGDLWASLGAAVDRLEEEFDSAEVADWRRTPEDEQIRHSPIGVTGVPPIHWVNRPTFQLVVSLPPPGEGAAPAAAPAAAPSAERARATLPATGGSLAVAGLLALAAAVVLRRRSPVLRP